MSVVALYFGWPSGAVYSNLVASAICAGLLWWRLHRQHVRRMAQAAAHHLEQLAQRELHHEELKEHVTAAVAAVPRPASRRAKTLATEPARKEQP